MNAGPVQIARSRMTALLNSTDIQEDCYELVRVYVYESLEDFFYCNYRLIKCRKKILSHVRWMLIKSDLVCKKKYIFLSYVPGTF